MKNPPWLAAAGSFSARDNAQANLGSQWKSSALFVLQVISQLGAVDEVGCGLDGAEDADRGLIGHAVLKCVAEGDHDGVVGDDGPFGFAEHLCLTDEAGKPIQLDLGHAGNGMSQVHHTVVGWHIEWIRKHGLCLEGELFDRHFACEFLYDQLVLGDDLVGVFHVSR